jgi:hypothetical protein
VALHCKRCHWLKSGSIGNFFSQWSTSGSSSCHCFVCVNPDFGPPSPSQNPLLCLRVSLVGSHLFTSRSGSNLGIRMRKKLNISLHVHCSFNFYKASFAWLLCKANVYNLAYQIGHRIELNFLQIEKYFLYKKSLPCPFNSLNVIDFFYPFTKCV